GMAWATYGYLRGAPEAEMVKFGLPNLGLPGNGGPPASISPDGRWIVRSFGGTNRGLDSFLLDSATRQSVVMSNVLTQPFGSPDSRSLGFFEDGMLKKADLAGGPAQNICEAPAPFGGGTWSRDGVILFSKGGTLYRVLAAGGQPVAIAPPDASKQETELLAPSFLPDGRHYFYFALNGRSSQSGFFLGLVGSNECGRLLSRELRAVFASGDL